MKPESSIELDRNAFGELVLTLPNGERAEGVLPVRAFPFSAPNEWVTLLDCDGHEVLSIPDTSLLPAHVRAILEQELDAQELIPRIEQIHSTSSSGEPSMWQVTTHLGKRSFLLPSTDHLRRLADGGLLITDSHGVRYRIVDRLALDGASRRLLQRYL